MANEVGGLTQETHSYHEFAWKIVEYSNLPEDVGFSLDSPAFDFANATWCIRMYPNGKSRMHENYVGMVIERLHSNVPDHRISYRLSIQRNPKRDYVHLTDLADFTVENNTKEMDYFVRQYRLEDDDEEDTEGESTLTADDTLVVFCQMRVIGQGTGVDATSQTEPGEYCVDTNTLRQNLRNVFLYGQNHDLTLKVMDLEFRVHQDVLRARSPVFDSMLRHDMVEKNSGVITIEDCDPAAFKQFLLYIYSGKVETLDENIMVGLYYVADKYDMAELKIKCREFIRKSLSTRVVCDVIELASSHSDSELLGCSTEYFIENINEILPTVEWQSFLKNNTTKANEMLIKAANKWTREKMNSLAKLFG